MEILFKSNRAPQPQADGCVHAGICTVSSIIIKKLGDGTTTPPLASSGDNLSRHPHSQWYSSSIACGCARGKPNLSVDPDGSAIVAAYNNMEKLQDIDIPKIQPSDLQPQAKDILVKTATAFERAAAHILQ